MTIYFGVWCTSCGILYALNAKGRKTIWMNVNTVGFVTDEVKTDHSLRIGVYGHHQMVGISLRSH
jgi:hypothetical protein